MSLSKRRRYLVDKSVQGALAVRAVGYWCYCLIAVSLMIIITIAILERPHSSGQLLERMWQVYVPAVLSSLLLLPLVVIDVIRWSNRFAGPLFRVRRALRDWADGKPVKPIHLREGDFWSDLADSFNAALARSQATENAQLGSVTLRATQDQVDEDADLTMIKS